MQKQVMVIEYDGERVRATHYCGGKERVVEMHNFDGEDDFLYCCAYLVDEMARSTSSITERGFEGKTVCAEGGDGFTVGKIYAWENGRTANDNLEVYPKNYRIGESCGIRHLISVEDNRFIVLKEH